jgi:hypothetical protein
VLEFEAALFEPTVIHPDVTAEIIERHRSRIERRLLNPDSGLMVFAFHRTPRSTIQVDTCSGNDKERPHKQRYHRKNWPYLATLAAAGFIPRNTAGRPINGPASLFHLFIRFNNAVSCNDSRAQYRGKALGIAIHPVARLGDVSLEFLTGPVEPQAASREVRTVISLGATNGL